MDSKKIEILKMIQNLRDKNISIEFETLEKEGCERGLIRAMIGERLIKFKGIFSLANEGEKALRDYLLIDSSNKKEKKEKIIFDNDILNKIVEGELNINSFKDKFEFYATHIQTDQFSRCKDKNKRAKLTLAFSSINPTIVSTESFVLGTSRLGFSKLGDGEKLENLRKGNSKHTEDALIGEVAINNSFILITNDKLLKKRVNQEGGKAINLEEFKEMLK
ncbi:hypothetical protein K8R33_03920 [archaeon]|nr:hypothetical protein [archaeon]